MASSLYRLLILTFTLLLLLSSPVLAQETDYPCYWRNSSGQVINLGNLCKDRSSQSTPNAEIPSASTLQALIHNYPEAVSQDLNRYFSRNYDRAIAEAKTACRVLRYGGSAAAEVRQQALARRDSSTYSEARRQITTSIALTHYCPEFANH